MIVLMLLLIVTMMKTLVMAMTIDGRDGTDRVYKRQRRPPPSLKHNPEHSVVFRDLVESVGQTQFETSGYVLLSQGCLRG